MNRIFFIRLYRYFLKKDTLKNIILFISTLIISISLYLTISFVSHSQYVCENETQKSGSYFSYQISKVTQQEIPNSTLRLSLYSPPEDEFILENNCQEMTKLNYSYFFFSANQIIVNDKLLEPYVKFVPLSYEIKDIFLSHFKLNEYKMSLNDVFVNQKFIEETDLTLDSKFKIKNEVTFENDSSYEKCVIELDFVINNIIDEFLFLLEPTVYYFYDYVSSYFYNYQCLNTKTIHQIVQEANRQSELKSYSYFLLPNNLSDVNKINSLISLSSTYSISSSYLEISSTFKSLITSFSYSLIPFLIIQIVITIFLLYALSYSLFITHQKEASLMLILGANKKEIIKLFHLYFYLIAIFGFFCGFLLANFIFKKLINNLIYHYFSFPNLLLFPHEFMSINYLGTILYLVLASLFILFISYLPFLFFRQKKLLGIVK